MAEPVSVLVAGADAPPNWLHSADVVLARASRRDEARELAAELLRRCPGCLLVCVLGPGRRWVFLNWRSS